MAEGEGFEPPRPFGRQFSRLLPCAVGPSLHSVRTEWTDRPPPMRQTIESSHRTNGLWGDGPESSRWEGPRVNKTGGPDLNTSMDNSQIAPGARERWRGVLDGRS